MALVHRPSLPFLSAGMGTVVEHPILALGEIQNNMQANSTRNSVEIIDVDAHDELPASSAPFSQAPPRPLPALRPRHSFHADSIISLVDDSDDEVQVLSDPIQGSTHNRHRLRSPPPYNIMATPPPPVPPVPRRYASFSSFPATRVVPPFSVAPVRPNPQPFAFEQNVHPRDPSVPSSHRLSPFMLPSRRTTVPQAAGDAPPAVPPSHHLPSMGLGGALLSSNNARAQQAAAQAARAVARMGHAIRRRPIPWLVTAAANFDELLHDQVDNPPHIRRWLENQRDHFVRIYNRFHGNEESQAKYLQRYTHPAQPEPGFTFDFAPNPSDEDSSRDRLFPPTSANAPIIIDDDDEHPGSLTSSADAASSFRSSGALGLGTEPPNLTTILVCAKCMAPLLLNESLGPDDSGRRVWALRCGHMIDEQCLNDIGQPDEEAEQANENPRISDKKGKGKAKVRPKASYGEAVVEPTESNNIRSRLRSAASAASSSSSAAVPNLRPPTKRRRTTAAVPKIEAEFEWKCPVPSCQLVHASVKIDGKWGPEKEAKQTTKARGAIPVFA